MITFDELKGLDLFITSDEHYNHTRIIKLCNRPFNSIEQMNEVLISRFNTKVPDRRTSLTIHVGDFIHYRTPVDEAIDFAKRLNGQHWFVFGNHDELIEENRSAFSKVFNIIIGVNKDGGGLLLEIDKQLLYLHHYAHRVWHKSHAGSWHCFGHTHDELCSRGKSFDIGVDGNNFTPWAFHEIKAKMETLKQHHIIDKERNKAIVHENAI